MYTGLLFRWNMVKFKEFIKGLKLSCGNVYEKLVIVCVKWHEMKSNSTYEFWYIQNVCLLHQC